MATIANNTTFPKREIMLEIARRKASCDLLSFMRFCWWNPFPLSIGRHTRAVCDRLTQAVEDYRNGKSTYLIITIPFRHGKSDIVSRALPSYFLGRCKDLQPSVIMTGYGAELIEGFSRKAKMIIESSNYQKVFGQTSFGKCTDKKWSIRGSVGEVTAVGLGGAITGQGGDLVIIDDYCKSRAEAVSKKERDKVWDGFRNDVFTRLAPNHILLVTATPWHVDDLIGRIKKTMTEEDTFPKFEILSFPSQKQGEYDYLFPERFAPSWYDGQRAVLASQATALLDCNPIQEGGNRFNVENVVIHTDLNDWYKGKEIRAWDLASSSKERDTDDPDWTWGIRGCVSETYLGNGIRKRDLWISSMVAVRAEAPERNRIIQNTAIADGMAVSQAIEAFGAYKDTYTQFKQLLNGISIVRQSRMCGDKSQKATPLEVLFETKSIHIYLPNCRQFLEQWKNDFATFPDGVHDDAVDATAILFNECTKTKSHILI